MFLVNFSCEATVNVYIILLMGHFVSNVSFSHFAAYYALLRASFLVSSIFYH